MRSDEELMRAYKAGDTAAFRELFDRYGQILLQLLARDLYQPEAARDLVQQTFLQLHRARLDFDETRRFKPWLFTIALNLKREYFRTRRRRPEALAGDSITERAVPPLGQERADARQSVSWALAKIPDDQREVIELHWFEGLSFPEIAECLGIGAVAAKVRAHRGYTHLRALLGHPAGKIGGGSRGSGGDI
jgi:RNA polymerase sigma-70 factor (ECF subfamily)